MVPLFLLRHISYRRLHYPHLKDSVQQIGLDVDRHFRFDCTVLNIDQLDLVLVTGIVLVPALAHVLVDNTLVDFVLVAGIEPVVGIDVLVDIDLLVDIVLVVDFLLVAGIEPVVGIGLLIDIVLVDIVLFVGIVGRAVDLYLLSTDRCCMDI